MGESDLVLGVLHGVTELHGSPGGDAVVKRGLLECIAEMGDDDGEVEDPADVAVAGAGAVEGGGDVGLFEAVEQHGEVGEGDGRVGDVAGALQYGDGGLEQLEGVIRVSVGRFEPGSFRFGLLISGACLLVCLALLAGTSKLIASRP